MLRIVTIITLMVFISGCAGNLSSKYVVQANAGLIEVPSFVERMEPQQAVEIGFKDVSMDDNRLSKAERPGNTNAAVVDAKTEDYVKSGTADIIIQPDNTRLYPFGLAQAKLTCAKALFCVVELQEGEQVLDLAAGDTVRWSTKVSYKGNASRFTAMVMIKPLVAALVTNLSIVTDRRDYNIIMTSIESGEYMPRIGFYYPQEAVEHSALPVPPAAGAEDIRSVGSIDIENVQFSYTVQGSSKLDWYPASVFDDGKKVFIKMSERARHSPLPVFHLIDPGGQLAVANYRYRKPYFIIDALFERGQLSLGTAKHQTKVVIRRK